MTSKRTGHARTAARSGSILMMVLVVMLATAALAAQGMQLMLLIHTQQQERIKHAQLKELVELGQLRLAEQARTETISIQVPGKQNQPARTASIQIEKRPESTDGWRILVRFPVDQPGETTVTWESP